jgi:hypothetical protein
MRELTMPTDSGPQDPSMERIGSGCATGPAFSSLGGYKSQAGSPALNAGVTITGSGVWISGARRSAGIPDVGAYETP